MCHALRKSLEGADTPGTHIFTNPLTAHSSGPASASSTTLTWTRRSRFSGPPGRPASWTSRSTTTASGSAASEKRTAPSLAPTSARPPARAERPASGGPISCPTSGASLIVAPYRRNRSGPGATTSSAEFRTAFNVKRPMVTAKRSWARSISSTSTSIRECSIVRCGSPSTSSS